MFETERFRGPCLRAIVVVPPRPGVSKPDGRKQSQFGFDRTVIRDGDLDQDVFDAGFRVFGYNVEIAIFVEQARVKQFELAVVFSPPPILFHQFPVGKFPLRIFIKPLHVRMRRGRIQIKVVLLDVFAVITFIPG